MRPAGRVFETLDLDTAKEIKNMVNIQTFAHVAIVSLTGWRSWRIIGTLLGTLPCRPNQTFQILWRQSHWKGRKKQSKLERLKQKQ
jgi:hypothetical protein